MMKIIPLIIFFLISFNLYSKTGSVTGLEIPRFVSLKSNEVNLRVGPSTNYPIELMYVTKNLPVEIIDEFDAWRKIKDHRGTIGWLHKSLIQGERFALTGYKNNNDVFLYNRPNGSIIGAIKKNNILDLKRCVLHWCKLSHKNINYWVLKKNIWGIYEIEIYNNKFYQPILNLYWRTLNSKLFN
jgi:SH3-like domain-containing protein